MIRLTDFIKNEQYTKVLNINTDGHLYAYILENLRTYFPEFMIRKDINGSKYKAVYISDADKFIEAFLQNKVTSRFRQGSYMRGNNSVSIKTITENNSYSNCFNWKGDCSKCVYNSYHSLKDECNLWKVIQEKYIDYPFDTEIKNQPCLEIYNFINKIQERIEDDLMRTSQKGITFIKSFEGCTLTSYRDGGGIWTIGYGHTGLLSGKPVKDRISITQQKAENLLIEDLQSREALIDEKINEVVKIKLTQNQFDALISFVFNVGITAFLHSTMYKYLITGNYTGASHEFCKWIKDDKGKTEQGLVRRRAAEEILFNTK